MKSHTCVGALWRFDAARLREKGDGIRKKGKGKGEKGEIMQEKQELVEVVVEETKKRQVVRVDLMDLVDLVKVLVEVQVKLDGLSASRLQV